MYRQAAFVFVLVTMFPVPACTNFDNLARLLDTLKTMQRVSCDDELVSLTCPRGTTISIQVAQYDKVARGGYSCLEDRGVPVEVVGSDKCIWPNSMQYALLQSVVEACRKKPSCRFSTSPKPGQVDPCPHTRKFVEVAYKCKPMEFHSRQICEGETTRLSCTRHHRLAIYEAQFGRRAHETLTCPQPQSVLNETCFVPHVTEKVMQQCHGRRRCDVTASKRTFGDLCHPSTTKYLKIVYTCVPLGVLTERYESAAENDEIADSDINDDSGDMFGESLGSTDLSTVVPAAPVANYPYDKEDQEIATAKREDRFNDRPDVRRNVWLSYVYAGVAVLIFIILTLILIGVRCYIIRRSSRRSKATDMYSTQVPNVFNDAASEIDNDIDLAHISGTFYDHPDMILYGDVPGSRGTLRAMRPMSTIYPCAGSSMYGNEYVTRTDVKPEVERDVVMSPKTLSRYSTPNMHYG